MFILKLFWRILHFGTTIFDCANFFVPFWKTSDKVTMKSRFVRQIFNTKINYLSNSAETTQLYIKINHGWLTLILIAENDRLETTLLFCFEYTGNTLISRYIVLPFLPIIFSTDLTHVRKYLNQRAPQSGVHYVDQENRCVISPSITNTLWTTQVLRKKTFINWEVFSWWCITTFSEVIFKEICDTCRKN